MIQVRQRKAPDGLPKAYDYYGKLLLPGDIVYNATNSTSIMYCAFIVNIASSQVYGANFPKVQCLVVHPDYIRNRFLGKHFVQDPKKTFIKKTIHQHISLFVTDKYKDLVPQEALIKYYAEL